MRITKKIEWLLIIFVITIICFTTYFFNYNKKRECLFIPEKIMRSKSLNNSWEIGQMFKTELPTIIVYADSTGCTGCKLQLDVWKYFLEDIQNKCSKKINVLFILNSTEISEINYLLLENDFKYPVVIDRTNEFGKKNNIMHDEVFIIDKKMYILHKGNPLISEESRIKFCKYYIKEMS